MKKIKKLLKDQRGQGMLEYVLLLAVIIAIGLAFKGQITGWMNSLTGKVGGDVSGFTGGGNP
jgi:Flp pilus assembly pilin Flp